MRSRLVVALVLSAAPAAAQTAAGAAATSVRTENQWIQLGRKLTDWFFAGQTDSLMAYMSPDMIARVGGADGLLKKRENVLVRLGGETSVIGDRMTSSAGRPQYWRESKFELGPPEPEVMRLVFDSQGLVIDTGLSPLSQAPAPDRP